MLILRYLKTNFMCRLKTKLVLLVLRFLKTYEAWSSHLSPCGEIT